MNKNESAKYLASLTKRLLATYEEKHASLALEGGLTGSEFKCLGLFGSDKGQSNRDIARRMNLSDSRLTRIIDGLVDKGYLTKEYNRRDSRCVNLNLSRKGKSFVKKVDTLNEDAHKKIMNDINASQQKFLISGMEKLCSTVEKLLGKNK